MVSEWKVEKDISVFYNLSMKIEFQEARNASCKKKKIQHEAAKFSEKSEQNQRKGFVMTCFS